MEHQIIKAFTISLNRIEHQYHGRFLIELLQNAHDALFDVENQKTNMDKSEEIKGRIEIEITDEPPFGALYATQMTVHLSQNQILIAYLVFWAQSDKDPEKHIGNKGIGFRSVLEITRKPEIFSRKEKMSESFNGFRFRFNPSIIHSFHKPIKALLNGNDNPNIDLGCPFPMVDWGKNRLRTFREKCLDLGFKGVASELNFFHHTFFQNL